MKSAWARTICRLLIVLMIWTPYQVAQAGMIGTDQAAAPSSQADRAAVLSFVSAPTSRASCSPGPRPATAKDRVAAMTDAEVQYLAGRIERAARGRRHRRCDPPHPHHRRDLVVLETLTHFGRKTVQNARVIAGVLVCACALALSGCASMWPADRGAAPRLPQGLPERIELREVPFFPQERVPVRPGRARDACSPPPAVKVTPEELVPQVYLPERKGSLQVEMLAAARRHGLVSYQLAPRFEDLLRELAAGNPVIVLQNLGVGRWLALRRRGRLRLRQRHAASCARAPPSAS